MYIYFFFFFFHWRLGAGGGWILSEFKPLKVGNIQKPLKQKRNPRDENSVSHKFLCKFAFFSTFDYLTIQGVCEIRICSSFCLWVKTELFCLCLKKEEKKNCFVSWFFFFSVCVPILTVLSLLTGKGKTLKRKIKGNWIDFNFLVE